MLFISVWGRWRLVCGGVAFGIGVCDGRQRSDGLVTLLGLEVAPGTWFGSRRQLALSAGGSCVRLGVALAFGFDGGRMLASAGDWLLASLSTADGFWRG